MPNKNKYTFWYFLSKILFLLFWDYSLLHLKLKIKIQIHYSKIAPCSSIFYLVQQNRVYFDNNFFKRITLLNHKIKGLMLILK